MIGRDNTITFLRLVIAFVVVFEHCAAFVPDLHATGAPWVQGRMFFLIVTGLVLYPLADRIQSRVGWFRFYLARWARLAPALVVYLALVPVVIAAFGVADHVFDWRVIPFVAQGFVLLPRYDLPVTEAFGGVTGHLYTIVIDVTFFVLLPLLVAFAHRFGFWRMIATVSGVALAGSVTLWVSSGLTGSVAALATELVHHSFAYYAYIVAGMAAAALWHRLPLRAWMIGSVFAITAGLLALGPLVPEVWGPLKPLLLAAPMAYLIAAAAKLLPRRLERFAIGLGDLSYPVFVLHPLAIIIVGALGFDGWGAFAIVLLSVVPIAWVITRFTNPFARLVRNAGEAFVAGRRTRLV